MSKRVFIGVGHGGNDPGAVANGLYEEDINLQISLAMQAELVRNGAIVGISRIKDENDPLSEEIAEANAFMPDLAVEVHTNAGGGDGFEVYRQTNAYAAKSKALAEAIEKQVKLIGQNSRGVKTRLSGSVDYYGWCREVKAPAVLCECAFIDSADRFIIDELDEQKAFGVAYAKGVLEYLGIAWIPPKKTMYGVVGQQIALSDKAAAEKYASGLNTEEKKKPEKDRWFWKVIEIA